ncbi:MAG: hypothetical protein U1E17_04390 [Geminicoccaceae bacterium]
MITCTPLFWSLPTAFLAGTGAAAGIAIINSIGNLAGFVGPYLVGYLKDQTGSTAIGMHLLAGALVIGAAAVRRCRHGWSTAEASPPRPEEEKMPRFAANLSLMFTEWDFLDRFDAAAGAGFPGGRVPLSLRASARGDRQRLARNGLTQALVGLPPRRAGRA